LAEKSLKLKFLVSKNFDNSSGVVPVLIIELFVYWTATAFMDEAIPRPLCVVRFDKKSVLRTRGEFLLFPSFSGHRNTQASLRRQGDNLKRGGSSFISRVFNLWKLMIQCFYFMMFQNQRFRYICAFQEFCKHGFDMMRNFIGSCNSA